MAVNTLLMKGPLKGIKWRCTRSCSSLLRFVAVELRDDERVLQ